MVKLIIDDLRVLNLGGNVVYARNLKEALYDLRNRDKWDELYLDHDLGPNEDIWPVIEFIEERWTYDPVKIGQVFIITSNPVGAQRMKLAFDRMGYPTSVIDPTPILAGVLPW